MYFSDQQIRQLFAAYEAYLYHWTSITEQRPWTRGRVYGWAQDFCSNLIGSLAVIDAGIDLFSLEASEHKTCAPLYLKLLVNLITHFLYQAVLILDAAIIAASLSFC